jgi:cellulose synthase/poly-beta-1,6-N-acetylglucosamine synthase-like glycosyltransferase
VYTGDYGGGYWVVVFLWLSGFFVLYFIGLTLSYLVFFGLSIINLRRYRHYVQVVDFEALMKTSLTKPVSLLVPAFNEERHINDSVRALLTLHYSQYEVIVINDGSSDRTMEILKEAFHLVPRSRVYQRQLSTKRVFGIYESRDYPNLIVVDKENGGKSDALNVGINISQYPYFCTMDADTLLERDALLKMIRPFIEEPDSMVAVGGVVRVANNCVVDYGRVREVNLPRGWVALAQVVEYLMSFLASRVAFADLGMVMLISGAFGMYRKSTVIDIGGYRTDTIGEDMELIVRMNRILRRDKKKYKIFFTPVPVCWTEVPTDLGSLGRQRRRWQKGLVDSIRFNAEMLLNPRYGRLGMIAMPYYIIFELAGGIVELLGYALLLVFLVVGVLSWKWALLFLLLSTSFGFLYTVATVLVEELSFHRYRRSRDLLGLMWGGIVYNCGFRQINAVWRLQATLEYFGGLRKFWGTVRRYGFRTATGK